MDAESDTGAAPQTGVSATRWILIIAVVVALVLFIAWARREPGFDDRVPDPEDAVAAFVVPADRGPDGGDV
jgi:LPXTG-motif cell wall-anchored protein